MLNGNEVGLLPEVGKLAVVELGKLYGADEEVKAPDETPVPVTPPPVPVEVASVLEVELSYEAELVREDDGKKEPEDGPGKVTVVV